MMKLIELKKYLENNIYGSDRKISTGKFKSLSKEIKDSILYFTQNCKSDKFSERIYWIINDFKEYPVICKHPDCINPVRFKGGYGGIFCSYSCNSKYKLLVSPNPFSGTLGIQRRKDGMMKKYGVDHNMKTQESLENRQRTYLERHGVDHPLKSKKIMDQIRKINEAAGRWTPEDQMEEFYRYRRKVWHFTNQQPIHTLSNYEKRGHPSDKNAYSLDHMYSCHAGFKNNIPPYIIGNIANLEYIPTIKNSSKRENCSLTEEELYIRFNKHQEIITWTNNDVSTDTNKA